MLDAVVIGAGINGLAAAVHLASKGWSVAVVERADCPGGAVRTEELTLPGYRHDLFAMNVSLFAGSAFYREHKVSLDAQGLAFVPAAESFASVFPNGRWLGVSTDLDKTCERIGAFSTLDARQWREMAQAFPAEAAYIGGILALPMPSFGAARLLFKAWREKGLPWVFDMVRLLLSSPRNFLDPKFESEEVRALMSAWAMHLDFSPDSGGGALFPYLESMACQNFGMVIGKGGADTIVKAMVGALEAAGGEVILGAEAASVVEEGGRATAVMLSDGRRLEARRAIIANVHPRNLVERLVPDIAPKFAKGAREFRPGPATMMIHLALDSLPDWSAGSELQQFAYVHIAPGYDAMAKAYQQALAGLLPSQPVLVVGQPTVIDPSRAPAGKHVLWIQVRAVPFDIAGDASGTIAASTWDDAAVPYVERLLGQLESYAPGLRGKILGRAILTPRDLERMNPNLVRGDSLAGSHHLDQNFLFRPVAGWSRWRTPIRNLYMVGASTWPGAGTGAGSGFMLASQLA